MAIKNLFRLIFVSFSLYLLGDAFSRWDGFSYYGSFSEFLPAASLAFILWSIISLSASLLLWMTFKLLKRGLLSLGFKAEFEHLLLYVVVFVLMGAVGWMGKKLLWPDASTTLAIKLSVFVIVSGTAAVCAWVFRNRAGQWMQAIQERITPLVWLFGLFMILSVGLVTYNTWLKQAEGKNRQKETLSMSNAKNRPNILLVTFDALAARDMSLYGYDRETTPFINKWAENATVFSSVEANSNFTTSATASLMTGKRVWTHQVYHLEGSRPVRSDIESLPAVLKENGYYNVAFVVNPHTSIKTLGMSGSFEVDPLASEFSIPRSLFGWKFGTVDAFLYRMFGDKIRLHNWILQRDFILSKVINVFSRNFDQSEVPVEVTFNRFIKLIDDKLPEPYFAWIHVFPPHDPYLPPAPYKGMFSSSLEFRDYKGQEAVRLESFKYMFEYKPLPAEMQPSIDLLRAYYDESIRYSDNEFGGFIRQLEKRNKLENTIVLLSADHGESFEHGYFTHGGPYMYEQVTHIPLIIKEPGQNNGRIIPERIEQIDISATILGLADIPVPSWMEGRSLVPALRGESIPPRPAFSMYLENNPSRGQQITKGTIVAWEGDYKLIYYLERNETLLFNLKQDPGEITDLFDKEPDAADHMYRLIKDNLDKANENIKKQEHY